MARPHKPFKPLVKGVKKPGLGFLIPNNDFFEARKRRVWPGPGGKPNFPQDWSYSYSYFNVDCSYSRIRRLLERVAWEHLRNMGPTSVGVWPIYTVPVRSFMRLARFLEIHVDQYRIYEITLVDPLRSKLLSVTSKCKNPLIFDEYMAYMVVFNWPDPEPVDTLTGARYDLRELFYAAESGCLEAFSDSVAHYQFYKAYKNSRYRLPALPRPPKDWGWTIPPVPKVPGIFKFTRRRKFF